MKDSIGASRLDRLPKPSAGSAAGFELCESEAATCSIVFDDVSSDVGANRRIDEMGNVIADQDFDTTAHYNAFIDALSSTPIATGPADSNEDGIPDAWILSKGFAVSDDMSAHEWPSGYIGVEEYLNEVDR